MSAMGPKAGDLEPPLIIDVSDPDGLADLTTVASWRMVGRRRGTTTIVINDAAPVPTIDPANHSKGYLTHIWVAGETALPGVLEIVCKATWSGSRQQTFPNSGFTTVTIDDNIS